MRNVTVAALLTMLLGAALLPAANAQQFGPAQQQMPGYYVGPSPVFPGYQPAPIIGGIAPARQPDPEHEAPTTTYLGPPQYVPSYPRYLPAPGGGLTGSTFRSPY